MEPGDVLFAYTDGVPDAKNAAGVKFGKPRMKELLDQPVSSAKELLDRIYMQTERASAGVAPVRRYHDDRPAAHELRRSTGYRCTTDQRRCCSHR